MKKLYFCTVLICETFHNKAISRSISSAILLWSFFFAKIINFSCYAQISLTKKVFIKTKAIHNKDYSVVKTSKGGLPQGSLVFLLIGHKVKKNKKRERKVRAYIMEI